MNFVRSPATATTRLVQRSSQYFDILLDVIEKVAVSQNLDEALETVLEISTGLIGSECGTVFINDPRTNELFSRFIQGNIQREIRIMNNRGLAGWCYTNGEGMIVMDAYKDPRFAKEVDEKTGFETSSLMCAPIRSLSGKIIGVTELLNKKKGIFTKQDLELLESITEQAQTVLHNHLVIEEMNVERQQERELLDVVSQVSSELNLSELLRKIMGTITRMLDSERSTLFINDEKTKELYTEIGEGLGATQIRFPNDVGIAGTVFQTGESINIPHAYADLRFNPSFDKQTGFFTRSILCTPVINTSGKIIGVTQVLNKKGGTFTREDEARLNAFTSQISIGIENAALFNQVDQIRNYNESILESMTNGVITINNDGCIETCNKAGRRILKVKRKEIVNKSVEDFFSGSNRWLFNRIVELNNTLGKLNEMDEDEDEDRPVLNTSFLDTELACGDGLVSVNVSLQPLTSEAETVLGTMILFEDISSEKRMKSTMSRYMNADLADKLMKSGEDALGGKQSVATILFSDVRSFTTLSESLGAHGTVSLLNDYFTLMVDCVHDEGGMLDKFIGDAMMVIFGIPFGHDDDSDRGVRSAIQMMRKLKVFNEKRVEAGLAAVDHGMGLNTDSIVSGNIGSPKRMDYTVIGDGVNLAARLESACKAYGARILLSEYTFQTLKGTYKTRRIDNVVVKGKTKPVGIYEVLDYHDEASFPNRVDVLGYFNDGFEAYQEGRFIEAIKCLKMALKGNPNDKCSSIIIDRCQSMIASPPRDWNGVWVFTSK